MQNHQIQEFSPVTIQIDESQVFLTVKDAKQIINAITELKEAVTDNQLDTKKILEVVTNLDRLFNPKVDGEKGIMVKMAAYEADIAFLKRFVYGGWAIYGFIVFCLSVYVVLK